MTPEDFQKEVDKTHAEKQAKKTDSDKQESVDLAKNQVIDAMVQSTKANMKHRENTTSKVDVQNPIAEREDIAQAVSAINNLAVLMLSQGQQKPSVNMIDGTDLGQRFADLGKTLTDLLTEVKNDTKQDDSMQSVIKQLDAQLNQLKNLQVAPDPDVKKSLANVEKALNSIDLKPVVNVPSPKVTVQGKDIDLSPVVSLLNNINDTLEKLPKDNDETEIISGLDAIQSSINNLTFPVPNYVLPFVDSTGKATQVKLDASGNLPVTGGGGSGGTQYTDGAAAVTHPIGTQPVFTNGSNIVTAVSTANPLPITGTISVGSTTDESAFTAGTSTTGPIAGVFNDAVATLTSGQQGTIRSTTNRGLHINIRNAAGTEIATSSNPLRIDPTGSTTQPVSGTVTANAGTNLNTSALALESGGNLASIKTDVDNLNLSQGSTTSGQKGNLILGAVTTSAPTYTTAQSSPFSLDTSGNLRTTTVLGAGTNVIGHVITDSGSTTAVTGTVSISGTVTANIGTTNGLALDTSVNGLLLAQGSTTSGQSGPLIQTATTTSAPTYTTAKTNPLSTTTAGALRVDGSGTTQPVSLSSTTITGTVAVTQSTSPWVVSNGGTFAVQAAQSGTWNITNISGTVSLPTGASTSALQTTGNTSLSTIATNTTGLTVAQGSTTSGQAGQLIQGAVTTSAPSYTTAQTSPLSLDTSGNLRTTTTLGASSNVIGHVITDTGSTTAVTGTVTISGTVTANAGTNLNTSLLALESGGNLASIKTDVDNLNLSQGSTTSGQKGNLILGAVTTAAPTYTTAQSNPLSLTTAGALRIDGSGSTQPISGTVTANAGTGNFTVVGTGTFVTQSTLAAETTKVIGTVRTADGSGNLLTSTSNALDINIKSGSIANTSFGATQATAANLNATVVGTGTFATQLTGTTNNINNIAGTISLPTGAATSANQSTEISSLATLVTSTHAEDAASASGDIGVFALGIRNDTVADSTNTNGDYTQFSTDVKGHILTANAPRLLKIQQQTTITSSTAETTVLTSVASTFLDVYGVIVANTSATACDVAFKDATAGTTRFDIEVPAGETRGFMLPIDAAHNQAAVTNNWTATCGTSVASIKITMLAVKNI